MSEKLTHDLFGDVTTLPSGRRGRPSHRWSQTNEDRVIMGLAMGYTDEEIANGIGVSLPTLKKYYFSVVKLRKMQRSRFELWRAEVLAKQAGEGNVGAMRELAKIVDKRDQYLASERMKSAGTAKEPTEKLGKKEEARRAAEKVSENTEGGWGNLLDPRAGLH